MNYKNKKREPFGIPEELHHFPPVNNLIARQLNWFHKKVCDCHFTKMENYIPELVQDVNDGETILFNFKYKDKFRDKEYPPHVLLHLELLSKVCHAKYNKEGDYILDSTSFVRPIDKNLSLWRYQDIKKFKDLINTEELHLSNISELPDPLEGKPTKSDTDLHRAVDAYKKSGDLDLSDKIMFLSEDITGHTLEELLSLVARNAYINCWHSNDRESEDMWDTYGKDKNNESVVIRTNVEGINKSIKGGNKKGDVNIYEVHYLDYDGQDRVLPTPYPHILTHKDKYFMNENEYRILHIDISPDNPFSILSTQPQKFKRIQVNIPNLVQEVRVHPRASIDTLYKTRQLVNSKFPHIPVLQSDYRILSPRKGESLDRRMKTRRSLIGKRSKLLKGKDVTQSRLDRALSR